MLVVSFLASAALMLCILLVPALQAAFQLTALSALQWMIVVALSVLSIVQMEVMKVLRRGK